MSAFKILKRHRVLIGVGMLAAIGAAVFLLTRTSSGAESTVTYQTETVATDTISATVSGTGNATVDGTTDVYSEIDGDVASVAVTEGSTVATGDVLFTLDSEAAERATAQALATYRQVQQSVAQAKASVLQAEGNLSRLEQQSKSPTSSVSSDDIAIAKQGVAVAAAGLASAQANATTALDSYNAAQEAENDLAVVAPCSGVIYEVNVAGGDSVSGTSDSSMSGANSSSSTSSGAPVVIMPDHPFAVCLTVNEADIPSIKIGQRADIAFDALPDATATGKVYEISETGTTSSGVVTFEVWVSIDVAPGELREGMSASVTIITDVAQDTLVVSSSAIQTASDGSYYVQVMKDGASTPTDVAVTTGISNDTQTQVLSGLTAGETVVTATVTASDDSDSSGTGSKSTGSALSGITGVTSGQNGGGQMAPPSGGGPGE